MLDRRQNVGGFGTTALLKKVTYKEEWMATPDDIARAFVALRDPKVREAARLRGMFRDREHARQVWDDWDGISYDGEDAHAYLNLIGDGEYCAV